MYNSLLHILRPHPHPTGFQIFEEMRLHQTQNDRKDIETFDDDSLHNENFYIRYRYRNWI